MSTVPVQIPARNPIQLMGRALCAHQNFNSFFLSKRGFQAMCSLPQS